jgi:hypothetical protein
MKHWWLVLLLVVSLDAAPKRLLILGQKPDGHPPGTHEYMPGARLVAASSDTTKRRTNHQCFISILEFSGSEIHTGPCDR